MLRKFKYPIMYDNNLMVVSVVLVAMLIFFISIIFLGPTSVLFRGESKIVYGIQEQKVQDHRLKVETVYEGLEYPTSMTFIGSGDILVTEKDKGTVQRIIDGKKLPQPVFDAAVANENERGLLGIIYTKNSKGSPHVYLYFTESTNNKDDSDYCPEIIFCIDGNDPYGARIYRYDLDKNTTLKNPKLILDLPATPGSDHVGGGLLLGPDGNIYLTVGDGSVLTSLASNVKNGTVPDGRGGILKIPANYNIKNSTGIFGNKYPLNLYYAYGIRNGFGLDFDPITGRLWDTENGRNFGDEINLVEPGFNSGWNTVQGIWDSHRDSATKILSDPENSLVQLDRKGRYSIPEFIWYVPVGVTAIKFFDSDKLGKKYENDLFVADIHKGNIYHFDLNEKRSGLNLEGKLADKVANYEEDSRLIFATGFHGVTDIEVGPDGYLYLLSFHNVTHGDRHHYYGTGSIYRIVPSDNLKP
jgi:Glucose/sorbosone dehydrogenases